MEVERIVIFLFGVLFVILVIVLAIWLTRPTAMQSIVFRIVLALVAAAFFLAVLGALGFNMTTALAGQPRGGRWNGGRGRAPSRVVACCRPPQCR
jgi:hypothetical protein